MLRALTLLVALVAAPAVAVAQQEAPPTPPPAVGSPESVEPGVSGEHGEHAGGHEGGHGGHGDPTKHYNWFDLGYGKKDLLGGKLGDGMLGDQPLNGQPEEPMSAPFVLMLVNFGILLVILAKYGGPQARKMAETRSDQIKGALDEAAKLRSAAQAKLDEYTAKLTKAQGEMDAMLANMRADAEAEKVRILAAAEAQAAAVQKDAAERIAAEIQRARFELTREVALAATAAAEQILRKQSTPADQTKQIDNFITGVTTAGRPGAV